MNIRAPRVTQQVRRSQEPGTSSASQLGQRDRIRPLEYSTRQESTTTIWSAKNPLIGEFANTTPEFSTIQSTPRNRALNLYRHNSVINATTIRPVTAFSGLRDDITNRLVETDRSFLVHAVLRRVDRN